MRENWRLILQKDTSAAYGLAVDETTVLSVSNNHSAPILHLYNFLPCVVLGRYQSADQAIDIQACRRRGLEINRRHTGGGTVLMGPKQLALGFSIPRNYPGVGPSINDIFNNLGGILCKALGKLGVKARFRPKNDIEIGRKKIAGLSASLEERDVAFFHTSLLLDFNFKLMLEVFKLPIKKLKDKHVSCFTERMTTVRKEKHRKIDLPSFQSVVRKAFEEHFGVTFRIDTLNQWELEQLDTLLRHRYTNPEWIFSRRHPSTGMGFASTKTPGGLIELGVILSGGVIEAAYLSGDFLSTSAEINQVESALRYCAASKTSILKRLRGVMGADTIFKVDRNTIVELALKAAQRARVAREEAQNEAERARKAEEKRKVLEAKAMRSALKVKPPEPEEEKEIASTPASKKKQKQVKEKTKAPVRKKATIKKPKSAPKKKKPAKKKKASPKKAKPARTTPPVKKAESVKNKRAASKKTAPAKKVKAVKKPKSASRTKTSAKKKKATLKKKAVVKKARPARKTAKKKPAKTTEKKTRRKPKPSTRKSTTKKKTTKGVKDRKKSGRKPRGTKR